MIQVQNLQFKYPGNQESTLKGLDFKIGRGEIFGFLGPSGAGKSTTQKVLFKTLSDFSGQVLVDGRELRSWDKTYFESIGVGFESPNHYGKLTGKENLDLFDSFYPGRRRKNTAELFAMVGLEQDMDRPVDSYSKGMKMRLNFIRAIQHDPEILFFDEPTSGLDPVNAKNIRDLILKLKADGKTIFITTHNMLTADYICDRISFIVDGHLRITETPENLKNRFGREFVKVELNSGEIREFPLKDLGYNEGFQRFLQQDSVRNIHSTEATLEEVFIQVTGKELRP